MKEFIYTNNLIEIKFYGLKFRFDVIFIDNKSLIWVVTKRTSNPENEETWTFNDYESGRIKFKEILKCIHTSELDTFNE